MDWVGPENLSRTSRELKGSWWSRAQPNAKIKVTSCPTISLGSVSVATHTPLSQGTCLFLFCFFLSTIKCCNNNYTFCQQFNLRVIDSLQSHTATTNTKQNRWAKRPDWGDTNSMVKAWQQIIVPHLFWDHGQVLTLFSASVFSFIKIQTIIRTVSTSCNCQAWWNEISCTQPGHGAWHNVHYYYNSKVLPVINYIIRKYCCINNLTPN